ncbi:ECF transporter S component [Aeromicrobium sp. UC242_57]|uniref:ECF transporter S component n=1 Tax=Aeromicrobium sp. UC242_57 TaxID=3374624 RepID=UPI00379B3B54
MSSAITSTGRSLVRYRTIDLVTITTLGVAFGVIFWGWGKLYAAASTAGMLSFPPSVALFGGGWLIAGVVIGLIVRKPGAALAGEVIAASISALLPGNEWGMTAIVSGLLQGAGVEIVLAIGLYRRFGVVFAAAGAALAAVFEVLYEWSNWYSYWGWGYKLAHLGVFVASGIIIAGIGGFLLVRGLARAGALDAFEAGREQVDEV